MEPLHSEQLRAVEAILREALVALRRFEQQELAFKGVADDWNVVRNRLAHFELMTPQAILQGLIDRHPLAPHRSLADRLWELRRELFAWGPCRASTWEEFSRSNAERDPSGMIASLDYFLTRWRLFFDCLGVVLNPDAASPPGGQRLVTLGEPPPAEPDGPFDVRRDSERVFGLRVNGIETEFTSDEEAVFNAVVAMWPPDPTATPRPLEGAGGLKEALGTGAGEQRWGYNLARKSRIPCARAGLVCHLATDHSRNPTTIRWVPFGGISGNATEEEEAES